MRQLMRLRLAKIQEPSLLEEPKQSVKLDYCIQLCRILPYIDILSYKIHDASRLYVIRNIFIREGPT